MNQKQIEQLSHQEYCHMLAYGEPTSTVAQFYYKEEYDQDWISTLESTTYPDMTFGYLDTPYMSTVV